MATTRSKTERFDASYRSLRIYWPTRWRLLWWARIDRRAGLPIGLSPETTPVLRDLVTRHDEICERERAAMLSETHQLELRLAQIEAELPALRRSLADRTAEAERMAAKLPESMLTTRRAGEQQLAEALVRQRRLTEHQRLLKSAEAARRGAEERLDRAREEQARLVRERQQRLEIASSRALRYGDHTQRLAALYRRALAKRHPQREQLTSRWQTDICRPPKWVVLDDVVPSYRAAGAPA